jgi:uncharacterized protein YkwD
MHYNYITLRALAVYVVVLMHTALHVVAESALTTYTTSTIVVATEWVVVTSSDGEIITYTTSDTVTGSTIGVTIIAGSTVFAEPTDSASASLGGEIMAWEGKGFRDAILNSTNLYRSQHQANALKWDKSLASYAHDHAKDCKFAHSVSLNQHSLLRP